MQNRKHTNQFTNEQAILMSVHINNKDKKQKHTHKKRKSNEFGGLCTHLFNE